MLCISRYTNDTYSQQFGDGRHKFYLEFRCNNKCLKNVNYCSKCVEKSTDKASQSSRKFNHNDVNESIPDNSHIFGGKWYNTGAKKWGAPPSEIIEFALQYQKEARGNFVVNNNINNETYKDEKQSIIQEMPRAKKTDETIPSVKRTRKPKIAPQSAIDNLNEEAPKPTKNIRKPKVAPIASATSVPSAIETPKKVSRKKPNTLYNSIINSTNQLIHKEVSIPTHIETQLEEINSEDYYIEYIQLSLFDANGSTCYRDTKKNKLYKKIKEKGIGDYIGRWNPDTDSIINIPDSDDEE